MSNIKCIIVEDEPLAVKILQDYVAQLSFLELTGTFKDALLATKYLREHPVDLIFLDLHLPRLKGMPFLKTLANPPAIIITTAYHQYALEGYELNVTDYLLKPFEFERFVLAINKVKKTQSERPSTAQEQGIDFIFLMVQKRKVKILFSEITYVESQREYVKVNTTNKSHLSKMSSQEMESILPSGQFKRIHRSYIISIDKIESYTAETVEVDGTTIPIGRSFKDVIKNIYG